MELKAVSEWQQLPLNSCSNENKTKQNKKKNNTLLLVFAHDPFVSRLSRHMNKYYHYLNPLRSNINMHVLPAVLYIFLWILFVRI